MVERSSPFASEPTGSADGVTLGAPDRGSLWQVACWPDTFAAVENDLAQACATTAPGPGQAVQAAGDGLLIRVEPLKWWVIGPDGASCPAQPGPDQGAWLDMSHDQAGITLTGPNAAEIVKRMVSLDLREDAFPDLSFATTQMHHMITRVLRHDRDGQPSYQIMVMRSYADDLREIAQHHLHHFG